MRGKRGIQTLMPVFDTPLGKLGAVICDFIALCEETGHVVNHNSDQRAECEAQSGIDQRNH
jgi:hypothetical protein